MCICKPLYDIIGREKTQLTCFTQIGNTLPVVTQENMCQAAIESKHPQI